MTVTPSHLTRAAGVAAAGAGLLFVGVQIGHPPMEVDSVTTVEWMVRNDAKVLMCALALAGITGMYLRQVRRVGVLGAIGYLLFGTGFLLMMNVAFVAGHVLPALADSDPGYVGDVLAKAVGDPVTGDIGSMGPAIVAESVGYLGGGLLFGIALFRARVLSRWASALLAAGTLATIAIPMLPHAFERPLAVPTGIALIGLGVSLWRDRRPTAEAATSAEPVAVR